MENDAVYIEINPHEVNYVNRILEGYEYLGILTTIDPRRCIHSTADTRQDVIDVLTHLDIPVKILSREETLEAFGE